MKRKKTDWGLFLESIACETLTWRKENVLLYFYAYDLCDTTLEKATLLLVGLALFLRYDVRCADSNLNEFEFFTEYSS